MIQGDFLKKTYLNSDWEFESGKYKFKTDIPSSVYSVLLDNSVIDNLYFGDNELKVIEHMKNKCVYTKHFSHPGYERATLCFDGVDTVSDIYLNGKHIGKLKNMHRKYEYDITEFLKENNELTVEFPPIYYVFEEKYKQEKLYTEPTGPFAGAKSVRKSFCMSGWDWAPRLADMGIWKDVYLVDSSLPSIEDIAITQNHNGKDVSVRVEVSVKDDNGAKVEIQLEAPDKSIQFLENNTAIKVNNPALWWPVGYGDQNLYTLTVKLTLNGEIIDESVKKIGLRKIELVREPDEYGESYFHRVNGKAVFAMGACYVPEDILFTRITPERTEKLLDDCLFANFNTIRVWGGGHYPHDFFYDLCDKKGILVFEDLMYACSTIPEDVEVQNEFFREVEYNLKRIRHHACLAVICGNNEMELWTHPDDVYGERYLDVFENKLPKIVKKVCADIPFVTSSPTSKGGFDNPNDDNIGDQHFWDVWAKNKPIYEYRKHHFRYLSEYGLSAFPDRKTIDAFTNPEDRNAFSRIMEMHQRCVAGNKTILSYIVDNYKYPSNLDDLIYLSQLVQASAVECGAEHQRANRGRSMGALYWQLNDIWPCISFSGIDYFGRYKAVQYFAKRAFSPISVICEETGENTSRHSVIEQIELYDYSTQAKLFVSNETDNEVCGELCWELRNNKGEILKGDKKTITVKPRGVYENGLLDFFKTDFKNNYISYSFMSGGEVVSSGTRLFTAPKYFNFINPELTFSVDGEYITVKANAYAKAVQIISDRDIVVSDNFFDLNADSKVVRILSGNAKNIHLKCLYDI